MNYQKGQSLVELLIAMGVFALIVSATAFLILDSYIAHRAGREHTQAAFLAEEGLEAVRSIRDSNWDDLVDGSHGIAVSGDSWIFQGTEENISSQLNEGKRKIVVSTVDDDRKEIQSQITWEFSKDRPQEVILTTYLTNWQKELYSLYFSLGDYSISEDGGSLIAEVVLSTASGNTVEVDYETVEGTATEPEDYTYTSGTLTFDPGDDSETFSVPIIDDGDIDPDEFFYLVLSNPQNADLGDPSQAIVNILDNDGAPLDCWGTGGSCDPLCQYANYGSLTDYYTDPGCSDSCPPTGNDFYTNPGGTCSDDGSGSCYKMETPLSASTICTQDLDCEQSCTGTCTPCDQLNRQRCRRQDGCSWFFSCWGTCTPCDQFPDSGSCGPNSNQPQYGCSWGDSKWYWILGNLEDGYSSSTTCEWY